MNVEKANSSSALAKWIIAVILTVGRLSSKQQKALLDMLWIVLYGFMRLFCTWIKRNSGGTRMNGDTGSLLQKRRTHAMSESAHIAIRGAMAVVNVQLASSGERAMKPLLANFAA